MTISWEQALGMIRSGHDVEHVLDLKSLADNEEFRAWFLEEAGPEALAKYDARIKDIDSGVYGARNCWHSISPAQRRALVFTGDGDGRLVRHVVRNEYRDATGGEMPPLPIRIKTLRNLCVRDLMAWDGGAFDPEAATVITERGRFILAYGQTTQGTAP